MNPQTQIERCARTITAIAPSLPSDVSFELLDQATERGYFLADEDEYVRQIFSRYLTTRAVIESILKDLEPLVWAEVKRPTPRQPEVFLIAFCAACMLVRSGSFLVDRFRKNRIVWRKLDEAEPRYGIPRKQFTKIYRSLTSARNVFTFHQGIGYFQQRQPELLALNSPTIKPVVDLLVAELPFIQSRAADYAKNRLKYRWHSFLRRHHSGFKNVSFGLFRVSGSLIAELRMKWKRKRVTPVVRRRIAKILQPGDVIITRHDDAASNLFLPGFWPHGALYIGTQAQRASLDPSAAIERPGCHDPNCVLEARKDGVLFRAIDDTLSVDACVVLRPRLPRESIGKAIGRAMEHHGKGYDFEFDFRRSDKLVCTEVIYRAFHGIDDVQFQLRSRAGRVCLSAEDLLDYAVDGKYFEIVAIYGSNGNRFVSGERARAALISSYRSSR